MLELHRKRAKSQRLPQQEKEEGKPGVWALEEGREGRSKRKRGARRGTRRDGGGNDCYHGGSNLFHLVITSETEMVAPQWEGGRGHSFWVFLLVEGTQSAL